MTKLLYSLDISEGLTYYPVGYEYELFPLKELWLYLDIECFQHSLRYADDIKDCKHRMVFIPS